VNSVILATLFAFLPLTATPVHVISKQAHINLTTTKVAALIGDVDPSNAQKFEAEMALTADVPGDRLILINSNGGLVFSGEKMIKLMQAEQLRGIRQVCVVIHSAHSMAFNLLTHCDVRLALPKSNLLMHKIAEAGVIDCMSQRCTEIRLREIATEMRNVDEPYRQANSKALHMSLKDYDLFADEEHIWTTEALLKRKYLHGLAEIGQ
jgi:ATP-dependent protease ClpP protease subunit